MSSSDSGNPARARASAAGICNALSVDVEEYFQVSAFEPHVTREDWSEWPSRVEASTNRLLDLFAVRGARATFFTLGWIAERHPGIVRRIVAEGHELGCHGYEHRRLTSLEPREFAEDTKRSKDLLEDVAGEPVIGYRAASFSIGPRNLWVFELLEKAGFTYSSSIYPVQHDHYGMPDAPRVPFVPPGVARLTEIPVSTARFGKHNVPAGGGGYFRLFPYAVSRGLVRRVNARDASPANMYFHPWEFDPEQPRPPELRLKTRFRHYLNQNVALDRLERLTTDFQWAPFREVYAEVLGGRCNVRYSGEPHADH